MKCSIVYNKDNSVKAIKAPNGKKSNLFETFKTLDKDPVSLYYKVYDPQFLYLLNKGGSEEVLNNIDKFSQDNDRDMKKLFDDRLHLDSNGELIYQDQITSVDGTILDFKYMLGYDSEYNQMTDVEQDLISKGLLVVSCKL